MSEKKLSTVRKLLAKAERAGTPEEADAFRAKATELMIRYQIDEATLAADHDTGDRIGSRRFVIRGYAKPKTSMLSWVGDVFGCSAVRLGAASTYGTSVVMLYGWESDLELIEALFASLVIQAEREMQVALRTAQGNAMAFKTSFLVGFAQTVATRLRRQRAAAMTTASTGAELVLVDRSVAVKAKVAEDFPKLRTSKGPTVSTTSAYRRGRVAGESADLGQGGLAGARKAVGR